MFAGSAVVNRNGRAKNKNPPDQERLKLSALAAQAVFCICFQVVAQNGSWRLFPEAYWVGKQADAGKPHLEEESFLKAEPDF